MATSLPLKSGETSPDVLPRRKNSTGSFDIKDIEAQMLPNYLRASIGSCHDICKYGKKRDLTLMTTATMADKLPMSPNKGRVPDQRKNLPKKNSLFTSRSPSTVKRSSLNQIKEKEAQPMTKKFASTTKDPYKLRMKTSERNEASSRVQNKGINASKQPQAAKGSKKFISVPATHSVLQKPQLKKMPKEPSLLKNKNTITKDKTEPVSAEEIPEKILFVTELNPENQAVGYTPEENISDDSPQCQNQTEGSLASLTQETEDVNYVDKEIDLVEFFPSSSSEESNGSESPEGAYSAGSCSSSAVSLLSSSLAVEAEYPRQTRAENVYGNSDGNESGSIKIVLRRQDVEQRNTEGLYNAVIEETARKLVENRKGKVKALVGAFETIISLQDQSVLEKFRNGDEPRIP